ncbi:YcnI family copper-binding membrane protein [Nocardia xishanensis]|uniref:YcnI family copper-binding membrane protein n=1 Tax=Nocardia xishanensis TaxID=238964 RepID=UPI0008352BC5|nr:YcnI family protein [Nocardia xishanensis]
MSGSTFTRSAVVAAAAALAVAGATGTAFAHVTVSASDASKGGSAVLVFRVPNESASGSPTVGLGVEISGVTTVDTETVPGWKAVVNKDSGSGVTTVTWTADPGTGIAAGQFEQFSILANGLPDKDELIMPATQTYADGQVVRWDQNPGDGEPEYPAPSVTLRDGQSAGAHDHGDIQATASETESSKDTTARWLGALGLALGALAVLAVIGIGVRGRH